MISRARARALTRNSICEAGQVDQIEAPVPDAKGMEAIAVPVSTGSLSLASPRAMLGCYVRDSCNTIPLLLELSFDLSKFLGRIRRFRQFP